jgi:putative hydrolase of the HAD superfamily
MPVVLSPLLNGSLPKSPPSIHRHHMSRIQTIFFDAAGTLFHVKGSVADIYLSYAEKYGMKRTPQSLAALNAAFKRAFAEAPPPVFAVHDPAEIKRCERLWWFDIVHNVFYRVGMFEGFDDYFDEVFSAFDGPDRWVLYSDTREVLKALKERGYELGIISNFDSRLFNVLRGLGILELFDTVTLSSLAHAAKPAPKIFHAALEKHATDPDDAVHVGDSVHDDVEGARSAGLRAILINREPERRPEHGLVIETLAELPPLVERLSTE